MNREISLNLIRHGKTAGNLKSRYIGTTDEPLCPEGIRELRERVYPKADLWFTSPMRRCLETAGEIRQERSVWMDKTGKTDKTEKDGIQIVPEFRECDFGLFENKNYLELSDCPEYQQWIDSNGTMAFPGGESPEGFKERSCLAFEQTVNRIFQMDCAADVISGQLLADGIAVGGLTEEHAVGQEITVNLIVHGGTIMSIMERYALPHREYYQWHAGNGDGYALRISEADWYKERKLKSWKQLF